MSEAKEIGKGFLDLCNILLLVSGLTLVLFGSILLFREYEYQKICHEKLYISSWAIGVGLIVVVVTALGLHANRQEHNILLISYAVLILILFVVQVSLGIFCAIYIHPKEGIAEHVETVFQSLFKENQTEFLSILKKLEKRFHCCGVNGPTDYEIVPPSCCSEPLDGKCTSDVYQEGCIKKYEVTITGFIKIIAFTALVFAIPEPIAAWLVLCVIIKSVPEVSQISPSDQ